MSAISEVQALAIIREHALNNYNKGWDIVIECYDDEELLAVLRDNNGDPQKAIVEIAVECEIRHDLYNDVDNAWDQSQRDMIEDARWEVERLNWWNTLTNEERLGLL